MTAPSSARAGLLRLSAAALLALLALGGCTGDASRISADPLMDMRNPDLSIKVRSEAVTRAWNAAPPGSAEREVARKALKDMVWATTAPADVRLKAVETLLDDPDPAGLADAREMARLRLATEPSRPIVVAIAERAAERGWTEFVPALVRSYARPVPGLAETERAERIAIETLSPGKPVERVAFDVFLNPPADEAPYGQRWDQRARADAWDVLDRIDNNGAWRRRAIAEGVGAGSPVLEQLRAGLRDLRCLPRTGDELIWLDSLLDPAKPENRRWWAEAAAAIAAVDAVKAPQLELRHAEVIRWAKARRPEQLSRSREDLLSDLRQRLSDRRLFRRVAESTDFVRPAREDLAHWADSLTWADLLTVIIIDDLVREPAVTALLAQQIALDRRDTTTEYGGILEIIGGEPRVSLYPPRASTRLGDARFIASEDMIQRSDRGLAHYHFHAQSDRNDRAAGPSDEDLRYARSHGRTCFILTMIRSGVADFDIYQPNGVVLDLGELKLPAQR
ncbi:MAG: hypothetical protein IT436_00285 [Phycisphaerales bacterium]|nr:hypothetical protein [Phycisphaerales bacterium]